MVKKNLFIFIATIIIVHIELSGQGVYYANASADSSSDKSWKNELSFHFKGFSLQYELDLLTPGITGDHPFGELIAKKIYLFEKKYISEVPVVPGNPQTKIQVQKPVIFNTTRQIEKSLKKSVRSRELSVESASGILSKVLDISIIALSENTADFEKAILSCNSVNERIDLFTQNVEIQYR
jgi:hypothetical protein